MRLWGGGDGTFLGRLLSNMKDLRSKDSGKPVRREASGTRIKRAVGDLFIMKPPRHGSPSARVTEGDINASNRANRNRAYFRSNAISLDTEPLR
jgi:hypothetical protein